jgi:hypothetical protein
MAERIVAYPGVVQALLMAEQQKAQEREHGTPVGPATNGGPPAGHGGYEDVKVIPLTPELAAGGMAALGLGGVIDYATSG